MKKKLNTDAIQNELEGSVSFPSRMKEPAQQEQNQTPVPDALPFVQPTPTLQAREQANIDASKHASMLACLHWMRMQRLFIRH
jgi:hypothetical protein